MLTNFTIHLKVSRLLIIYQQYGQLPTNERHFPSTSPFHVPLDCADRFLLSLQSWTRWYELCNPTGGLIELRNYPPYNSISHRKIQTKCLPFSLAALFPFHFRSYTSSLANQMYTLWSWLNTNKNINYQQNIWTPRFSYLEAFIIIPWEEIWAPLLFSGQRHFLSTKLLRMSCLTFVF